MSIIEKIHFWKIKFMKFIDKNIPSFKFKRPNSQLMLPILIFKS